MTTLMFDPSKGWFSAQELAGLPGMPTTDRGVKKTAEKNLWANRSKERGKGVEYALTSLPEETQQHLVGLMMDQAAEADSPSAPSSAAADFLAVIATTTGSSLPCMTGLTPFG